MAHSNPLARRQLERIPSDADPFLGDDILRCTSGADMARAVLHDGGASLVRTCCLLSIRRAIVQQCVRVVRPKPELCWFLDKSDYIAARCVVFCEDGGRSIKRPATGHSAGIWTSKRRGRPVLQ